jgi:hypothetical protein
MSNDTAWAEACALYRMLGDENTVEGLRELIAVPPKIEHALRAFARAHPEEAHGIESAIKFRQAVAREFERLVREGIAIAEMPEGEESELDATEATCAHAQA